MSKKHLGLLFSDIFQAKCVRERENSHCTRGRTRGCLLPRDTQEDTADQTTDCQTKWQLLDDRISKTIISRGVSQYSHFITETNVQQSEDSDFYRGICSFYPWSVISRYGLSKTTPRSVPWVWLVSSSFIRRSCRSCGLCIRDSWVCEFTFHLLVVLPIFTGYKTYKVYPKSKLTNNLYFCA